MQGAHIRYPFRNSGEPPPTDLPQRPPGGLDARARTRQAHAPRERRHRAGAGARRARDRDRGGPADAPRDDDAALDQPVKGEGGGGPVG